MSAPLSGRQRSLLTVSVTDAEEASLSLGQAFGRSRTSCYFQVAKHYLICLWVFGLNKQNNQQQTVQTLSCCVVCQSVWLVIWLHVLSELYVHEILESHKKN